MAWKYKSGFSGESSIGKDRALPVLPNICSFTYNTSHRTVAQISNELLEFLENPNPGQFIVYFGLTYQGKPCGFATLMLYPEGGVGIVDHIAIAPTVRGYGAFFSFCEFIVDYLEAQKKIYNYLVSEIVLSEQPYVSGMPPLTLLRLSRFVGFRLANIPYTAPDTRIVTNPEKCRAALMLVCQPDRAKLEADELIKVLKVIFFSHYLDWCRRTMSTEEFSKYDMALRKLYDEISSAVQAKGLVSINGMKNFDIPYLIDPHRSQNWRMLIYMIMVVFPAILTIALAFAAETRLAGIVFGATCLVFMSLLIPRIRNPILKFFQLE